MTVTSGALDLDSTSRDPSLVASDSVQSQRFIEVHGRVVARLKAIGQHARGGGWYDRIAFAHLAQQLHGAHAVFVAATVSREVVLGVDEQLPLVVHAHFCVVPA